MLSLCLVDWVWEGETPGLIPAVGISPLLFSLTRADSQFPLSVPNVTLVRPISVPHFILTSYPLSCLVFFSSHLASLWLFTFSTWFQVLHHIYFGLAICEYGFHFILFVSFCCYMFLISFMFLYLHLSSFILKQSKPKHTKINSVHQIPDHDHVSSPSHDGKNSVMLWPAGMSLWKSVFYPLQPLRSVGGLGSL